MSTHKTVTLVADSPFFWDVGDGYVTWSDESGPDGPGVHVYFLASHEQVDLGTGGLPYAFGNVMGWCSAGDSHVYIRPFGRKAEAV